MKRVALLGSTGSIGEQTLDVVARHPERFEVVSLAAGRRVERIVEQARRFGPRVVSVGRPDDEAPVREALRSEPGATRGRETRVVSAEAGLVEAATVESDLVVAGLVGAIGLPPVLAAIRAGRAIGLANKEVMVMAGALVRREAESHDVPIVPIDSEHSAIFQCLAGSAPEAVERLILTCSGGPFRTWEAARIEVASVEEALAHPNWSMGAKISIDSATLMNKGLEVIEARWLFDVPASRVDVVVHPQSIVHSLVEFRDRSVLAQLGLPDMRVPIAVALAHPERLELDVPRLDLVELARLDFERPDRVRFPCLDLAYRAVAGSEAAPAVLNAANEVAVAAFLDRRLPFPGIAALNAAVLDEHLAHHAGQRVDALEPILAADAWAREAAQAWLEGSRAARGGVGPSLVRDVGGAGRWA
ncbi:MAG: 1-deoxy-D-xylulose-5-phosphate reductoisomerase [Spirochaetaceae bacterium]|nr:1-deoxy-D-xylulose-5-phosphate reductoisomerase [Myxococcales bacterium]MCB9726536.1 1-deoxy-D-xylulose-5-phosphate reductoisomerase [Spirochaetaceae bacterium]HPG25088.1 1-deoxy-D-xylulose-5-phosphate reductoisomerase [Myxococcota bacterium]